MCATTPVSCLAVPSTASAGVSQGGAGEEALLRGQVVEGVRPGKGTKKSTAHPKKVRYERRPSSKGGTGPAATGCVLLSRQCKRVCRSHGWLFSRWLHFHLYPPNPPLPPRPSYRLARNGRSPTNLLQEMFYQTALPSLYSLYFAVHAGDGGIEAGLPATG